MNNLNSTPEYIEIPLTKGCVTWVSLDDADLAQLKWCIKDNPNRPTYYACRRDYHSQFSDSAKPTIVRMHRIIMERMLQRRLDPKEQVDHINGNGWDNRRENLRVATNAENTRNRVRRSDNTSGFKGVVWSKKMRKWVAQIHVNGKGIFLGHFKTPEEAYTAYCAKGRELFGEFFNPG